MLTVKEDWIRTTLFKDRFTGTIHEITRAPWWIRNKQTCKRMSWQHSCGRMTDYSRRNCWDTLRILRWSHFAPCGWNSKSQVRRMLVLLHMDWLHDRAARAHTKDFHYARLATGIEERPSVSKTWTSTRQQEKKSTKSADICWGISNVDDLVSSFRRGLSTKQCRKRKIVNGHKWFRILVEK